MKKKERRGGGRVFIVGNLTSVGEKKTRAGLGDHQFSPHVASECGFMKQTATSSCWAFGIGGEYQWQILRVPNTKIKRITLPSTELIE
jgi:hypothetical protein